MMRVFILLAAVVCASVLAELHVRSEKYHPIIKVESPERVSFLAVLDAVAERKACGEANRRFLEPIKTQCPECRIAYARCERELTAAEQAVALGDAASYPLVTMPGVKISVEADESEARRACKEIAEDVLKRGVERARCIASFGAAPRT